MHASIVGGLAPVGSLRRRQLDGLLIEHSGHSLLAAKPPLDSKLLYDLWDRGVAGAPWVLNQYLSYLKDIGRQGEYITI